MRVLCAGGGGFIGRHLVAALIRQGHEPVVLCRRPDHALRALAEAGAAGVEVIGGDVLDQASLTRACQGCDGVAHLVAIEAEQPPVTFEAVHVQGTANLLAAAHAKGAGRFVYLGQISPGPAAPELRFTYTKWRGEELVRASGLEYTVLRAGLVLGPGDHFLREVQRLASWPVVPLVGDGQNLLQPIAVWDVAEAMAACLVRPETIGATLDLAGDEQISYRDLMRKVLRHLGRSHATLVPVPAAALLLPARLMARLSAHPLLTPDLVRLLGHDNISAEPAAARLCGHRPLSLCETLRRALPAAPESAA